MLKLGQNQGVIKMTREEFLLSEIERLKRENKELISHCAEQAFYIELLENDYYEEHPQYKEGLK